MFNTSQNNKMVEVLSGSERRQRRLYLCFQAVEAISHIGDTGNQPDFGPGM